MWNLNTQTHWYHSQKRSTWNHGFLKEMQTFWRRTDLSWNHSNSNARHPSISCKSNLKVRLVQHLVVSTARQYQFNVSRCLHHQLHSSQKNNVQDITWNTTYTQESAMWPQCKHFFINRFSADGNIEHYNFIISAVLWTQDHGRVCGSKINQLLWQICESKMMADFDQDRVSLIAISLVGKPRRHCVMKHFQHIHLNINLGQNLVVRGVCMM